MCVGHKTFGNFRLHLISVAVTFESDIFWSRVFDSTQSRKIFEIPDNDLCRWKGKNLTSAIRYPAEFHSTLFFLLPKILNRKKKE